MIRSLESIFLFFSLVLFACSGNKKSVPVTLVIPHENIATHGENRLPIRIKVSTPYHFNTDFPSKVSIIDDGGLEFPKKQWGSSIFTKNDNGAIAVTNFKAPKNMSGTRIVQVSVDCSLCRADECRVFKGLKAKIPVKIKKMPGK